MIGTGTGIWDCALRAGAGAPAGYFFLTSKDGSIRLTNKDGKLRLIGKAA